MSAGIVECGQGVLFHYRAPDKQEKPEYLTVVRSGNSAIERAYSKGDLTQSGVTAYGIKVDIALGI